MSPNVKRFIELQTTINNQINGMGEAEDQLVSELELLGDQLTSNEVNELIMNYEGDAVGEMEYEDVEWMIE